jgi:hypothetical protein
MQPITAPITPEIIAAEQLIDEECLHAKQNGFRGHEFRKVNINSNKKLFCNVFQGTD